MVRTHALYWDENNAPNIDVIINILRRNYQDKDAEGLVISANFYTLTDNYAKKLNEKGYPVKPNTEYIMILQEQPYQEINCVFGYDDDFQIQKGKFIFCGSAFLRQYSTDEITEIEKMKAITLEEEFDYSELTEIEQSAKYIELRSHKTIVANAKTVLENLQKVQEVIKETEPYEAIGNDFFVCIDYKRTEYSKSKKVGYFHRNNKINDAHIARNDFDFEEKIKEEGISFVNHKEADILIRDYLDKKIKECNEIIESSDY